MAQRISRRKFGAKQKQADRNISKLFNPENKYKRTQKNMKKYVRDFYG